MTGIHVMVTGKVGIEASCLAQSNEGSGSNLQLLVAVAGGMARNWRNGQGQVKSGQSGGGGILQDKWSDIPEHDGKFSNKGSNDFGMQC
ncbi:hypothetical protein CUMW_225340 [Citrus unshiu]|uniref:Uncharacterized protein n=1 Tax=Citrus unshiu TaxID=55188 RepID=A0A2H5QFK5_CITUN|nr:hypothetical protein CUMW_225340 [Citrus unshiu]